MQNKDSTVFLGEEDLHKDVDTIRALQEQLFHSESSNNTTVKVSSATAHECHIRIATMNINGLSKHKLPVLLTYIEKKNIDVLCLQDTRLDEKDSKFISTLIKRHYNGTNIQVRIAPVPTAVKRADRVGGQLVIVYGKWAQRVTNFYKDHTHMGLLTGTTLQAHQHKILILSTYWPIKPAEQNNNSQLWNKVLRYLRELGDHSSPIDYIKHTIQERLRSHINGSPNNVAMLMGDINSTWGTTATGGCHKGTEAWAQSIALRNPLHTLSLQLSTDIRTHWMARHVDDGVENVGCSWIDHILLHENGKPRIISGGTETHNDWITISDHRPLWADLHLPLGGTAATLIRPYDLLPLPTLDRTNTRMVSRYREKMEKKILRLPDTLSPEKLMEAISDISVKSCPTPGKKTESYYNSTRFKDGWSPMLVVELAALTAITTMRQHITGESRRALWWKADDIDKGIHIITREWEQKLQQLRFDNKEQHEEAHSMSNRPSFWRLVEHKNYPLLAQQLRHMEKQLKKKMHGRQRSHDRLQMQNASADREKVVAAGKIGKAIKSILGKPTQQYDMHSLTLPSGELVMEPQKVHDTHVQHWTEWMGVG